MSKKTYNNPRVTQIFNDLEDYRDFCRLYGYRYNEADLYNMQSYPFQQFNKFRNGKNFKDQAGVDLARMR